MQTADFKAYRERIAAAAGMGAPTGEPAGQTAAGAVTGAVQDKGAPPAGEPKEVLKLSQGDAAAAAAAQQRARALEEELAAREKTIQEQTERVAKLEKTVKDMQALLDIKSKSMADAQRQAAPPPAPTPAPVEPVKPEPPVTTAPPPAPPSAAQTQPTPPPTAQAQPAPPAVEPPGTANPPGEPPKKPKPRVRMATEPPPAETSLVDEVLGNPLYLGGGAAIVALLGFLGFRTIRSRRAAAYEASGPAEKKNDEVEPPLTHTDTGGGMAAAARAAPPAAAPVSEEVDPLAEAEIYLAYGRDGQAEEILREAIQANPRRYEIHVKLLEIYAKRKDTGAFDTLAREVYAGTGGQGEAWMQVARLGYPLDPQNPRYAAGKTAGAEPAVAAFAAAAAAPAMDEKLDFNIGLEDTSHGTRTDIDLTRLGGAAGTSTDIDLSNLGAPGASEMVDLSTVGGLPQSTFEVPDVDLSLGGEDTASKPAGLDFDFDLSGLTGGGAPAAPKPSAETTQILDRSLMQTVADVGQPDMGTVEFDLSKISLDSGAPGKTEPTLDVSGATPSIPEIDLSGISLDLGTESTTTGGTSTGGAGKDDHWYDVQTKFDLAKAYQEMGDKEGAREILQEVLAEGDSEQKAAAQRVLEALT
jgi:pilus assembly protein FimV